MLGVWEDLLNSIGSADGNREIQSGRHIHHKVVVEEKRIACSAPSGWLASLMETSYALTHFTLRIKARRRAGSTVASF